MKTSEVLNRAANFIEEYGWERGDGWYEGGTGTLCLEGGIQAALDFLWNKASREQPGEIKNWTEFKTCPAYKAMQEYLELENINPITNCNGPELWRWNDNEAEDAEQVINALRAAALVESVKESKVEATA